MATLDDIIESWTDDELQRAIRRAWREAARSMQEARTHNNWGAPVDEVGRILAQDAASAHAHWEHLKAEVDRRAEIRRVIGIEAFGQCSHCSEPNVVGKTMCAGHLRLDSYEPGAEYAPNH